MEHKKYELLDSLKRMDEILDRKSEEYLMSRYIPKNGIIEEHKGCFVDCAVLGSRLYFKTKDIKLPGVAKIYDMYINEAKCILADNLLCEKIIVHGNSVAGVYNVGDEGFLNDLMDVAGRLSSLTDIINIKIGKTNSPLIGNVCGLEVGYLYALSSGAEMDFLGGMLNRVESWIARREDGTNPSGLFISQRVFEGLKKQYQDFFRPTRYERVLLGNVENVGMAKWANEQQV